jgi:hypothetical protein
MDLVPMDLSKRDLYLNQIENEINARRDFILKKGQALDKNRKANEFLEGVKNDYRKYYDYIIREKQQQYESMKILQQYLDDLTKTEKLADHEMNNLKYDQAELLLEMDKIKTELDKITRRKIEK